MRKLWINGEYLEGGSAPFETIDPATEEVIGEVSWGNKALADQAVQAAHQALQAWRKTPANQRAELLHGVAKKLRANLETLAVELTRETGRTIVKNRGYVEWSAQCFDYYAEIGRHHIGRVIPSPEPSQLSFVLKAPVGVVAAIVPWNYPLLLLAWKLAPALAAGNSVVIKPAGYTTWATLGWASLFEDFPPGVVNIVSGGGSEVGDFLVRHPLVRMIAFTGSTQVGQDIMRAAADDMKHVHLELGGKDPLIVCADAEIKAAAKAAVWGGFLNAGQVCTSIERVYVEKPVYEEFQEYVLGYAKKLVVGPGIDPASEVTPMIRKGDREQVHAQVQDAVSKGAEVLWGGEVPPEKTKGFYYAPTVIHNVTADMDLLNEETFGPVLPVLAVDSFEEALDKANQSVYGLGATLFTSDARKVKKYFEEIEAGNVWVNDPLIDNVAGPFGGMKRSGLGRELGLEGLEEFYETKHVHWEIEGGMKSWWYPKEE
ncbi:MAG: aldehyde dehydrogenase family protein [Anaerolineae bacterium]|nr:aldehyde dehydrogenase family protein [Anaerolineae bacterium]